MRLLDDVRKLGLACSLGFLLSACAGGVVGPDLASADVPAGVAAGPEADYPQVLGEPFTVDGQQFTPEDVFSYDAVGFATLDREGGPGISVAHKTLPYPSYVEVTSLDSGTTILARVERRGPMTASRLVALSPGAQAQLGAAEGTPVRVRRVNPPEYERAELRLGRPVPTRLSTPGSLLAVLKEKLPVAGSADLAAPAGQALARVATPRSTALASRTEASAELPAAVSTGAPRAVERDFDNAFTANRTAPSAERQHNVKYPLPPVAGAAMAAMQAPAMQRAAPAPRPVVVASAPQTRTFNLPGQRSTPATPLPAVRTAQPAPQAAVAVDRADGKFVVQAAAFASKDNADRVANKLDGFVIPAGRYFRVRTGPYATRGQAEAALAKVRAAGYSDAKVFSAG